jgi:hypothetical protein
MNINNNIIVKVNDEIKAPVKDYTIENNVLTFKVPPGPNDKVQILKEEENGKTDD